MKINISPPRSHLIQRYLGLIVSFSYFSFGAFILSRLLGLHIYLYGFFAVMFSIYLIFRRNVNISSGTTVSVAMFILSSILYERLYVVGACLLSALFALAFTNKEKHLDSISRGIVLVATIFSLTSVCMWFIVLGSPDLIRLVMVDDNAAIESGLITVNSLNYLSYLGFSTNEYYEIFGLRMVRLKSFLKEPSTVPIFFLIPLAVSIKYRMKKSTILITLFCILTFSGTVYVGFGFFILNAFVIKIIGIRNARAFFLAEVILFTVGPLLLLLIDNLPMIILEYSREIEDNKISQRLASFSIRLRRSTEIYEEFSFFRFFYGGKGQALAGGMLSVTYQNGIVVALILLYYVFSVKVRDIADILYYSTWLVGLTVTSYGYIGYAGFLSIFLFRENNRLFFPSRLSTSVQHREATISHHR
jgi:hypothetical protein